MKKYKPPLVGNKHETAKVENWIEEYNCGCSAGAKAKRDLPGYCAIHGDDRRHVYDVRPNTIVLFKEKE